MKIGLETKRGSSGLQQAREYGRIAKDVLQLVKVISRTFHEQHANNISHDFNF